ncbi:MAG: hypothetical protein ABI114_16800 [Rhodanobacter sp.]
MAQIQSSWFPRYAVNPQTYVENVFLAKTDDYRLAREMIRPAPPRHRSISMAVLPLRTP